MTFPLCKISADTARKSPRRIRWSMCSYDEAGHASGGHAVHERNASAEFSASCALASSSREIATNALLGIEGFMQIQGVRCMQWAR